MSTNPRKIGRAVALAATMLALAIPASAAAKIELGAYTPGSPANASALAEYSSMVGRKPDIVMWYRDFGQPLMYSNEVANLHAGGETPMITWEPGDTPLTGIAAGDYDSYLQESAEVAHAWGGDLMIRFGHEMNGTWYPWSASEQSPADFVAAWHHIVSVFRANGADNVKWVWSPNVQEGGKYPIAPSFPGEEWIDYVGLDGYNWGDVDGETWQSAAEVFKASYETVTAMSQKPVMITETSSSESGGDKADWIEETFMREIPSEFPRVEAVVWFNKAQEDDWRIDSSQASLAAYRSVVSCDVYGGSEPCEPATGAERPRKPSVSAVRVPRRVSDRASGSLSFKVAQPGRVEITVRSIGRSGSRSVVKRVGAGRHRTPLRSILRGQDLAPGRYRVSVTARDEQGRRSSPRRGHFRVV